MLIKNLPEPFRQLAYNNQIYQKKKIDKIGAIK
jgi:hypothetical protein